MAGTWTRISRDLIVTVLSLFTIPTAADVVTEFGVGFKLPTTSYLLLPECHKAVVVAPSWPENPRGSHVYSCGGDDPAFIGWPIAWERAYGPWSVRVGWFHYSNWLDGGRDRETHMDLVATTTTFNWTKWRKKKNGAR